jgi:spermidine synthase
VMTLENILIRISNLSFGSSSYSFSLIVSVFILSIAVGSYLVGRLKNIPLNLLFLNQLLITFCLLLIYLTLDTWPYWAHVIRIMFQSNLAGFWGYYGCLFLVLLAVLILPVGSMGATVPIAFHEIKRELTKVGAHSGLLLSLNTLGNLLGSIIGGILFYYVANNARIFLSAVLLAALSTILAARPLKKIYWVVACMASVFVAAFMAAAPFYQYQNFMIGAFRLRQPTVISFQGPDHFFEKRNQELGLKFYNDGPTATVAAVEFPKEAAFSRAPRSVIVNGKSDSSTVQDIYTLKLLAHLPAILSRARSQVMVIGLGTGVTAGELTLYSDIDQIDVAEISPSVIQALDCFKEDNYDLKKDPRVRISTGDAFRLMRRSRKNWDIIVSEPSNPWVMGVDLLFTREFYKLAKEHLSDQGVLAQWFHT